MARNIEPKNKQARREGIDLNLKTVGSKSHASLLRRLNVPPGMHAQKRMRKPSDYGIQLREKQKAKRIYGLMERQFHRYYRKGAKFKGATGEAILRFLEIRLDNVIYRLGFAPTRAQARQLVTHGHVLVDGKKESIPSFEVKNGNVITLTSKTFEIPAVKKTMENKTYRPPVWLSRKGPAGKIERMPEERDFTEAIDERLIVEYYSR
ncbi:30S ribosomal protein S4 [Candidatus Gottesmanbacteria bacterium]|nr:30S ribosomal protein S4 [Candidatus Gottesmanbacteria bacterium]